LITARLQKLVDDPKASPSDFEVGTDPATGLPFLRHTRYKRILFMVYPRDGGERSPLSVAHDWADKLEAALRYVRRQQEQAARQLQTERLRSANVRGIWNTVIHVALFFPLAYATSCLFGAVQQRARRTSRLGRGVRVRGADLIAAEQVRASLVRLIGSMRVLALLLLLAVGVQRVLAGFPATRSRSDVIVSAVGEAISRLAGGIVGFIPSLINIALILVVSKLILRGYELVMVHAEHGRLSLEPYVPQELIGPTRSLGKLVIVLISVLFIAPYIPGSGTDVAKVITVLIGLVISFSSTTTIGNLLAGVVIAYMRPFRRGDRVKMADTVGDIVDYTFLYTRVRTPKNEEVLVPNLQVLSSPIVNYSAVSEGLILHTTVSIGYDVPRTVVEALLLQASCRTEGCLDEPSPFVLIRSLDDFYVTYELNVYTRNASQQAQLYSRLHRSIKDAFDAAGVEILSPHHYALRGPEAPRTPGAGAETS
jgi:small-conductance mechanosensitive channel